MCNNEGYFAVPRTWHPKWLPVLYSTLFYQSCWGYRCSWTMLLYSAHVMLITVTFPFHLFLCITLNYLILFSFTRFSSALFTVEYLLFFSFSSSFIFSNFLHSFHYTASILLTDFFFVNDFCVVFLNAFYSRWFK